MEIAWVILRLAGLAWVSITILAVLFIPICGAARRPLSQVDLGLEDAAAGWLVLHALPFMAAARLARRARWRRRRRRRDSRRLDVFA